MVTAPSFETSALVTDDPVFAARVSSLFRRPGRYFPVLDGPRMGRSDAGNEVVRRRNALVMTGAQQILIGNVPDAAANAMRPGWPHCTVSGDMDDIALALRGLVKRPDRVLQWGPDNLGVGLYRARLERKELVLDLGTSPNDDLVDKGRHLLVACERGDRLAEVIASNLAFGFNATFATFPGLSEDDRDEWIEELYALGENEGLGSGLEAIANRARTHLGPFDFARFETVLWVTTGFPWGIATPETPATHMSSYPDFGRSAIEGLWASQLAGRSSRTALLIDSGSVSGSEIPAVNQALLRNGSLTRVFGGRAATVSKVQSVAELLPHDIIVLSSHAGDAPGQRITYEYVDADTRLRRLVVDEAVGLGYDKFEDKFHVTMYHRFHSLDGVDWRDKAAKAALPVGAAITSWTAMVATTERTECVVHQEEIKRVIGSMGIQLHDGTWFFISHGFAPGSAPLIINNSCWSWHEISERATYAGARGYVGCLVPIIGPEAQGVADGIFKRYLGRPLPIALWAAQRDVYGSSPRRPYLMVGLPCISIQPNTENSVAFMNKAYLDGIAHWSRAAEHSPYEEVRRNAKRNSDFLARDLQDFRTNLVRRRAPDQ